MSPINQKPSDLVYFPNLPEVHYPTAALLLVTLSSLALMAQKKKWSNKKVITLCFLCVGFVIAAFASSKFKDFRSLVNSISLEKRVFS